MRTSFLMCWFNFNPLVSDIPAWVRFSVLCTVQKLQNITRCYNHNLTFSALNLLLRLIKHILLVALTLSCWKCNCPLVCQSLFPKRAGSFYFQAPIGALIHTLIPLKDSFIYLSALNSEWLSIHPSSMQTIFAVC